MALTFMFRPSDIAPSARSFIVESGMTRPLVFGTESVVFYPQKGMLGSFHGIKYAYYGARYTIWAPAPSKGQRKCDPTLKSKAYKGRMDSVKNEIVDKPVFLLH